MKSGSVIAIFLLLVVFVFGLAPFQYRSATSPRIIPRVAWAESEEDEADEEEEAPQEEKTSGTSSRPKETIVTTYQKVQKTVVVLDEKFRRDTDGDLVVDGLDPHPTVPEQAYFTDDDEDGVPNALDQYPAADDFFAFEDGEDQDQDGVLDAFVAAVSQ